MDPNQNQGYQGGVPAADPNATPVVDQGIPAVPAQPEVPAEPVPAQPEVPAEPVPAVPAETPVV